MQGSGEKKLKNVEVKKCTVRTEILNRRRGIHELKREIRKTGMAQEKKRGEGKHRQKYVALLHS